MKQLVDRILQISKDKQLTHVGSCLSVLPILEEIYEKKKPKDKVILDNSHSHLAHLVVKEYYGLLNQGLISVIESTYLEYLLNTYGIHCDRSAQCDASGGSLGHGIGIGIGMALTDRTKDVHVIVSDGSMQEGSNWESLHLANELSLTNLHIYANLNGFTAVAQIDQIELEERILSFNPDVKIYFTQNGEGFEGVQGHYQKIL